MGTTKHPEMGSIGQLQVLQRDPHFFFFSKFGTKYILPPGGGVGGALTAKSDFYWDPIFWEVGNAVFEAVLILAYLRV